MRDIVGYGADVPVVRWPEGARIAVSLVVHFEEGAERCPLDGDAAAETDTEALSIGGGHRDLHVESMYEYGARAGVWRLLGILERHRVTATFLCCGLALERNPGVARAIVEAGHEPCGHGYRWIPYDGMSREAQKADIDRAIRAVWNTTGRRPVGWCSRMPAPETRALLIEEGGFLYDADSHGDDLPYMAQTGAGSLLTLPVAPDVDDAKFWARPGTPGFVNPENFFHVMRDTFDRLYDEGARTPRMMSVALHPRIGGRPPRALQLDRFLHHARGVRDVWFARREEIAAWWKNRFQCTAEARREATRP